MSRDVARVPTWSAVLGTLPVATDEPTSLLWRTSFRPNGEFSWAILPVGLAGILTWTRDCGLLPGKAAVPAPSRRGGDPIDCEIKVLFSGKGL